MTFSGLEATLWKIKLMGFFKALRKLDLISPYNIQMMDDYLTYGLFYPPPIDIYET